QERHTVSRLIGAPPGYVGYDEGGQLTEAVRRRPYSVVLLDEIEKAHPEVFNVLLQVLDDGRLTDGQGRTVDLRNAVIIMTSNLGSHAIMEEDDPDVMKEKVDSALRNHFAPEFLNRIDDIVIFHRLDKEHLAEIAKIQLANVERLLGQRDIDLSLTDAASDLLTEEGYDPVYGARPLKRVIQKQIIDPLAARIIQGDVRDGDSIVVDAVDDQFTFDVVEPAPVA
ncbi:MAG: AAA family ATPase, partial [Candidatus Promineifilaceae bacterium]